MEKLILIRHNVPIAQLTTFQTTGLVKTVVDFQSIDDVCQYIQSHDSDSYTILGRGSNSLINPEGTRTIIRMGSDAISPERNGITVRLGAGMTMNRLQEFASNLGLSGLEFAAGVPASLGGMVAMNFGCWGRSMSDFVSGIQIVDETGHLRWLSRDEAQFSYRRSIFHQKKWMVVSAEMVLSESDPDRVRATIRENIQTRVQKQPLRARTFGSIFKNPPGGFAAQLLEAAGLKGKQWDGVQLSDAHANFLVNTGDAGFETVMMVLQTLKDTVKSTAGIELELEVQIIQ